MFILHDQFWGLGCFDPVFFNNALFTQNGVILTQCWTQHGQVIPQICDNFVVSYLYPVAMGRRLHKTIGYLTKCYFFLHYCLVIYPK